MQVKANFDKIDAGGLARVVLKKGVSQAIDIKATGIPLKDIITRVNNKRLVVTTKGNHSGESILITVTYTEITEIRTSGAAEIMSDNTIEADTLNIFTNDMGDVNLNIKANTLKIFINDSGDANLKVDVGLLIIEMRDRGDLRIRGRARNQRIVSYNSRGSLDNRKLKVTTWGE